MKKSCLNEFKKGFAFVELILVLVIILFLIFAVFKLYFKKTPLNQETKKSLSEQGIDTTNYKTIQDSTKKKIQDIKMQHMKELDQIK